MKTAVFKKIVWAVDTREPDDFQANAKFVLGSLTRETSVSVSPVHILTYPYVSAIGASDFEQAYLALAEKRLHQIRKTSDIKNMSEGKVLVKRGGGGSVRAATELLLDYADEIEADAILVSTHSRNTVARLFMGSFAETLLLQSELPVFTVNPLTKVREKISRILYPSPVNKKSRDGFERAVQLAKAFAASLTAFYKEPYIPMLEPSSELDKVLEEEARDRRIESNQWLEWTERHHVPLEVRMDTAPGDVADEIQSYAARHNFDLIVMVSQTSDCDSPRVGSICRRVVRGAECPVLTLKTDDLIKREIT